MPFNKIEDYGTVSGDTDAMYHQNGKYYNNCFMETDAAGEVILDGDHPIPVVESPVAKKIVTKVVEALVLDELAIEESKKVVDFETLKWQEIKSQVIDAGGKWTNKVEGINYLRSL